MLLRYIQNVKVSDTTTDAICTVAGCIKNPSHFLTIQQSMVISRFYVSFAALKIDV